MSYEEYWYGDVWMIEAYRKADKLKLARKNQELWLMGCYVYEALGDISPVLHAFAKSGTKPIPYRKEPYPLFSEQKTGDSDQQQEEKERLIAEVYMRQMIRAGKNWGKK